MASFRESDGSKLELHRQMLDAADETRFEPLHRTRCLDVLEPTGQRGEELLELETREVRTETHVLADAEPNVAIRLPIDAEVERIVKDALVSIGGVFLRSLGAV